MSKRLPLVDIVMVTYNQENSIRQAIESVLMQKTAFPYRLIISDDCSSDNTYYICRNYANENRDKILLYKNSNNLGLVRNYIRCFKACEAKYVAILEGDDYWTDSEKIEKQIKILEQKENIGLVHTNYQIFDEESRILKRIPRNIFKKCVEYQGTVYSELIKQNYICPLTVIFRSKYLKYVNFDQMIKDNYFTVDYPIWLECSLRSEISYIPETTGVYVVSKNSISNNSSFEKREKFIRTKQNIKRYYLQKHPSENYSLDDLDREINMMLLLRAVKSVDYKNIKKYLNCFSVKGLYLCIEIWKDYL